MAKEVLAAGSDTCATGVERHTAWRASRAMRAAVPAGLHRLLAGTGCGA